MILISHRGNTNGKFESYENEPTYIDKMWGLGTPEDLTYYLENHK